jgi:hypothetical protein
MKPSEYKAGSPTEASAAVRTGAGSWAVLIVLISLLVATLVIVYFGWTSARETDVPTSGYVALVIGVIFSLAVGFGLMALVFYSSRKGYDFRSVAGTVINSCSIGYQIPKHPGNQYD